MSKWPEPVSDEPEIEDLIEFANDNGCTTSCEEECWVETDGECIHGHPSWILRLGLV